MIDCLGCKEDPFQTGEWYAVKKNGNHTGSKQVGFLCEFCFNGIVSGKLVRPES
jgi:hypothetical protein